MKKAKTKKTVAKKKAAAPKKKTLTAALNDSFDLDKKPKIIEKYVIQKGKNPDYIIAQIDTIIVKIVKHKDATSSRIEIEVLEYNEISYAVLLMNSYCNKDTRVTSYKRIKQFLGKMKLVQAKDERGALITERLTSLTM